MPFYRFQIEVPMSQQRVMERIRSLVREEASIWQGFSELRNPRDTTLPPLIGSADENSFKMRGMWVSNFGLPLIHGYVLPTPAGTQINVTMSMHRAGVVMIKIWGVCGLFSIVSLWEGNDAKLAVIFLYGVAFICAAVFKLSHPLISWRLCAIKESKGLKDFPKRIRGPD
jgi:hypothetical protein